MLDWYEVKTPALGETYNQVWHRNIKIEPGKKFLLTEEQGQLHGVAVAKSSPPTSQEECVFADDFEASAVGQGDGAYKGLNQVQTAAPQEASPSPAVEVQEIVED